MRITVFLLAMITLIGGTSVISVPRVMAADAVIEEVVVTARKRQENLQETPVSVMAFSSEELERVNVNDLIDLSTKLPNVNIAGAGGAGTNNASFYIRGLGSGSRNSPNSENSVGLYIDDAYYGKTDGAILDVVDVERIEVLRGPQGTLFGRNSTAGAIRYITKKPHFSGNDGSFSVTAGNYSRADVKAAGNIVLSDTAAARLTFASLNSDGYVDNRLTGKDLGDRDTIAGRAAFLFRPSDRLDVSFNVDYAETDTNGAPSVATLVNATPNGGIWFAPFAGVEDAENLAAYGFSHADTPTNDFFDSYSAEDTYSKRESLGMNLVFDYEISDSMSFKSATTYRNMDTDVFYDMDGVAAELATRTMEREIDVFTQEFQLSGSRENAEWVAGIFYLNEEAEAFQDDIRMLNDFVINNISPYGLQGGQLVDSHDTTSMAIFGQATFDLSDALALTTGLRYTKDEKDQTVFNLPSNVPQIRASVVPEADDSDSWSAPTGRLSLEWTVSDDVFTYASYSRGFRAGGINDEGAIVNGGFGSFDEEIIDSFEVGIRSDLFDNRVRLNLTAFVMDATDLQFTVVLEPGQPDTVIQNAGEAKIQGIEAELAIALSQYVTFNLDMGILDTEFEKVPPLDRSDALKPILEGDSLTHAPDLSYNASLDIDVPMSNGSLSANINYGWKDDYSMFPGVESEQDSYGLLGANVSYETPDGKWKFSVFGTNLTDEEYANIIMDIGGTAGVALGFRMEEPGRPREYGVSVTYHL